MGQHQIPPNFFAVPFGLAGLGEVWLTAEPILGNPPAVANAINIAAAAIWLVVFAVYASKGPRLVARDLRHPIFAPFVAVAPITGMLLGAALAPYAFDAARALIAVFLTITIVLGGWLTGQWITGTVDQETFHPGYFLPTVAGGLIGAEAAALVNLRTVAEASFGIGILCWVMLGSIILNRLFLRPNLPPPLLPTLAIEVAPPAVAGLAYNALSAGSSDHFAVALAGYTVLMALVQLRLIPLYRQLSFSVGFWAFTFAYAAVAADALEWLAVKHPSGKTAYAVSAVTLITIGIAAILVRTAMALRQGKLLPPPAPPGAANHDIIGADVAPAGELIKMMEPPHPGHP